MRTARGTIRILARFWGCLILGSVLTLAPSAQPLATFPRITRSPYLQSGTATSMVVRWRTSQPTTSVVRFGLDPDRLVQSASSPGRLKEHIVLVKGLNPGTRYYYSVGSERQVFQRGPFNYFTTSPVPGSTNPFRVWVLGDPGTDYPVQRAVRNVYQRDSADLPAEVILTLGDNAYPSGTDSQYQKGFFEIYRDILKHCPVWPALGNHDARHADSATESGVYYTLFTLPRLGQAGGVPSGTQAYYSFDYANAHFLCLDSQDSDLSPGSPMLAWLHQDLTARNRTWTIAYWHHPPYSKGSHDSDTRGKEDVRMSQMRETVVPILEKAGVDLVLCGHSHLYERSYLLQGHFGPSTTFVPEMKRDPGDGRTEGTGPYRMRHPPSPPSGTVYVNAGSAGHASKKRDLHGLDHPAMRTALNVPGSLVLTIDGNRLEARFLDDQGVRRDWFTLVKER